VDKKFLMGNEGWLLRSKSNKHIMTVISPDFKSRLIVSAIRKAYEFYCDFFNSPVPDVNYNELAGEYERDLSQANSFGLFGYGSINQKDHLNFWCLSRIYSPEIYIESGVFKGSSLHAFFSASNLKEVYVIDPNLKSLQIPKEIITGARLIDDRDFSELELDASGTKSLVFFDDHIDSASRIIQSFQKGCRYILFDDSTGMEGICQRLFPSIPSIPMIMNAEILRPGENLSWTYISPKVTKVTGLKRLLRKVFFKDSKQQNTLISLNITQELIDKCFEAKKYIKKYKTLPDLGEFIPQPTPERMIDSSKFIIELNMP